MRGPKTTCILTRKTETQDDQGGWAPSYSDIAQFEARLQALTAQEQLSVDRNTIVGTHRLQIGHRAINSDVMDEVDETNRIRIGTTNFEISGVTEHTGRGRHWNVNLRLVE